MRIKLNLAFVSFCIVGFLTAVIYFSLFGLFWNALHFNYKIALTIAYTTAVVFQFFANRNVTFKNTETNIVSQVFKFFIMLSINYVISLAVVTWSVDELKVSPYIGIVLSIGVTVVSGFLLSKFWVFKKLSIKQGELV